MLMILCDVLMRGAVDRGVDVFRIGEWKESKTEKKSAPRPRF